jgi:hypothetical protein
MSPDRQRALDALRQHQRDLAFWRKRNETYGVTNTRVAWAQNDVKDALDRYWGVISREEMTGHRWPEEIIGAAYEHFKEYQRLIAQLPTIDELCNPRR